MKEKFFIIILLVLCIFIYGCGKKNNVSEDKILRCIKEQSDDEGKITNDFKFYYKNDIVYKVEMVETYEFFEDSEEMIDMVINLSDGLLSEYKNIDGIDNSLTKIDNKSYKMIQLIDYDKLDIDSIKEFIEDENDLDEKFIKNQSIEEIKESFDIDNNFSCNIE